MPLHRRMTISQAKILFEKLDHVWNNTKAVGNRPFIPRSEFDSLLTEQSVSETICEITRDLEDGAITVPVDEIYRSYRKVLAILVMIRKEDWIAEFIDHGCSDGRLPLNATVLDKIDPEGGLSRSSFLEKQYLFLAQTIERNMEADWPESVVVPIIRQESLKAGRGGFATVSKIVIHSDYDNLLADGQPGDQKNKHVYACKILHQNPDPKALEESYRMEVEAGKRLRARNNANITPLLANFKHGNTYNLLFPFAECNLKDYFADEPPAVGHPDVQRLRFLEQIAKLASALSTIHNYVDSRVKGLEHYGYHRDLKPQNILKKGNTFMLADFGLTRFARPNEPNEQTGFEWDYGVSTYRAPECGHLGKKIGRRADIWSMACVFAEALTFSVKGSAGIKEFRERRTRKLDVESQASCVVDWFHDQYKVTKDVVDWLDHLGELNGGARSNLVTNFAKLVKEMMADVPKNRPNAKAVSLGLYNVLIREAWRLHVPLDLEKPITEDHEVFREKQNKLKRASSAIMFKRSSSAHEYASKLATMVDHYVCEPRPTKTRRRSAMDRVMVVPTKYDGSNSINDQNPLDILDEMDTMFLVDDTRAKPKPGVWQKVETALATFAELGTAHDPDGVDLAFVNSRTKFQTLGSKAAVMKAFSSHIPSSAAESLLSVRIGEILADYIRKFKADRISTNPLNLIVLTDGALTKPDYDALVKTIMQQARVLDEERAPVHQLGIQFVLIGSGLEAQQRFHLLDEVEYENHHVRDMVDHIRYNPDNKASEDVRVLYKIMCGGVVRAWDSGQFNGSVPQSPIN